MIVELWKCRVTKTNILVFGVEVGTKEEKVFN